MKGKFLPQYHLLLVENRLEEFEQQLASHFLSSYSYLDWLIIRKLQKQQIPQSALNSHYLDTNSFQSKHFFSLLQFLMYAQNLDFTTIDYRIF